MQREEGREPGKLYGRRRGWRTRCKKKRSNYFTVGVHLVFSISRSAFVSLKLWEVDGAYNQELFVQVIIMVQEEDISKNPLPAEELSTTPKPIDDQASASSANVLAVEPPMFLVPPVPTPTSQLPLLQPVIPPPPIPPSVIPPIAPIPTMPSVPRPLAPLPVRPPLIRPPPPQKDEANGSDSDSGQDDSGPKRAPSAMEYEISEESKQAQERQEKAMQELLMKRRAYALAVPTNDSAVRARLRRLGEPITLFGEKEMERRDRLRMIMVKLDTEGQLERLLKAHEDEEAAASAAAEEGDGEGPQTYPFYTEGSKALLNARIYITKYSTGRAALRLERARRRKDDPDEDLDAEMNWALSQAGELTLDCSEIGDDRPLTGCSFSHDAKLLATCAMSGVTKLWSMPRVSKLGPLKGHTERATDVTFSPVDNVIATASADCTAILWNTQGSILRKFEGHLARLARVAFHPSGKYLGTTSFDKTWRLWDIDTGVELLLQEGHSRSVYGISFSRDGSLAASCGLDALARVWDLRTGRSILALEGHVKPVLGVSFSPNGYHLATGGEDNTCRIWDLRKKKCMYIIPAHSNLISEVKFEPQEGYFLATASYDTTAKVWSARDFKPIKTLSGHEAKVTALDITGDGQCIATVAYDRTIKLWSCRSNGKEKAMDIDY